MPTHAAAAHRSPVGCARPEGAAAARGGVWHATPERHRQRRNVRHTAGVAAFPVGGGRRRRGRVPALPTERKSETRGAERRDEPDRGGRQTPTRRPIFLLFLFVFLHAPVPRPPARRTRPTHTPRVGEAAGAPPTPPPKPACARATRANGVAENEPRRRGTRADASGGGRAATADARQRPTAGRRGQLAGAPTHRAPAADAVLARRPRAAAACAPRPRRAGAGGSSRQLLATRRARPPSGARRPVLPRPPPAARRRRRPALPRPAPPGRAGVGARAPRPARLRARPLRPACRPPACPFAAVAPPAARRISTLPAPALASAWAIRRPSSAVGHPVAVAAAARRGARRHRRRRRPSRALSPAVLAVADGVVCRCSWRGR